MRKLPINVLSGIISIFLFHSFALCQGDGKPSVAFLDTISDEIVAGTATPEIIDGAVRGIDIAVLRVIKGSRVKINSSIQLAVAHSVFCTTAITTKSTTALWFLKVQSDGTLGFASSPKSQGCTPFDNDFEVSESQPSGVFLYAGNTPSRDKLGYELASSIVDHEGYGPFALIRNEALLDGMSQKTSYAVYRSMMASSFVEVHMVGLLGLIRMGDSASINTLASNLNEIVKTPLRTRAVRSGKQIPISYSLPEGPITTHEQDVADSVKFIANADAEAVLALGRVLNSARELKPVRYASARALRNIHTPGAAKLLVPLLDDNDPVIRSEAIGGIASLVNAIPVLDPSKSSGLDLNQKGLYKTKDTMAHFAMDMPTIMQRESYYLDYWKNWWNANSGKLPSD